MAVTRFAVALMVASAALFVDLLLRAPQPARQTVRLRRAEQRRRARGGWSVVELLSRRSVRLGARPDRPRCDRRRRVGERPAPLHGRRAAATDARSRAPAAQQTRAPDEGRRGADRRRAADRRALAGARHRRRRRRRAADVLRHRRAALDRRCSRRGRALLARPQPSRPGRERRRSRGADRGAGDRAGGRRRRSQRAAASAVGAVDVQRLRAALLEAGRPGRLSGHAQRDVGRQLARLVHRESEPRHRAPAG